MHLLSFFTSIFHYLPEELSHNLALRILKVTYSIGILERLIGKNNMPINRIDLNLFPGKPNQFKGLKNRLGIAAGLDKDGEYIDCLASLGIGYIEVGTVTPKKQFGNPKPRLFRDRKNHSLLNRLGFNNKGVEALVENLKVKKSLIPIGVSIGKNFDTPNNEAYKDYIYCMKSVYQYSSYIAINISSPNTQDLRELSSSEFLNNLLGKIKQEQKRLSNIYEYVPIFLKISPDESDEDIEKICKSVIKHDIDGIICSNTTNNHNHKNGYGGLSGLPLKNKATKKLLFVKKIVGNKVPIIASGGVMSLIDYEEKIDAGADLVQIYTGFIFKGPKLIEEIVSRGTF